MKRNSRQALIVAVLELIWSFTALAQASKPNIVFIMGDDIGWFNIGAYNQGMMALHCSQLHYR
jgi:hypothetical protein